MKTLTEQQALTIKYRDGGFDVFDFLEESGCVTLPFNDKTGQTIYFFQFYNNEVSFIIELRWNPNTNEVWLYTDYDYEGETSTNSITMSELKHVTVDHWSMYVELL